MGLVEVGALPALTGNVPAIVWRSTKCCGCHWHLRRYEQQRLISLLKLPIGGLKSNNGSTGRDSVESISKVSIGDVDDFLGKKEGLREFLAALKLV